MAGIAFAVMAISSCDEDTLTIGQTLTEENDKLSLTTATFNVSTKTIIADSVLSLSNSCYFGKVKDPETGTDVTSEFTTQFHVVEDIYIAPEDSIIGRYDNRVSADSCDITLFFSSPFKPADSLSAMKMRVIELDRPIEEGQFYYSNFNPLEKNLIRTGHDAINQGKVFSYNNLTQSDSLRTSSNYTTHVCIPLNSPYTAKNGTTYNNYGTYLLRQYFDNKKSFRNSYSFTHDVCPGFFFEVADGYGFHANVSDIGLRVFYKVHRDSIVNLAAVFAGTKEVLQTNCVTNDKEAISRLASETGCTYLKSPAGLFTQVALPVSQIKSYIDGQGINHSSDSLLAAKITFQRLNSLSSDKRMFGIPQTILMLPQDSLTVFFEKNKLPDSKTSFYTTYSSTYNTYTFSNISNLITTLWNIKEEGLKQDPQWTDHHPNWDKVVLVPISYTRSSSTSSITSIEHDMSLTSTRLVGGKDNPLSPIQLNIVYAKFKE